MVKLNKKAWAASAAIIAVGGVVWTSLAFADSQASNKKLLDQIQANFPNTKIGGVDCTHAPAGLCEVQAGKNVFYMSKDARFAFVGSVLDLKEKVDLTDKRLREISAVSAAEDRIAGAPAAAPTLPTTPAAAPQAPSQPQVLRVDLPRSNAVVHNAGAPLKMAVFTDLNCGFCRKLHEELAAASDIEVTEYPMGFLAADSAEKAKLALCSQDRAKAADSIYQGGQVSTPKDCDAAAKAVEANTAFGRQHNIGGTPTIVRADGAVHSGWMPVDQLRAWLKQGAA